MVRPTYTKIPEEEYSLTINFGCDPARVDELVKAVFQKVDDLRTKGPSDKDVSDAREALFREYETGMKQNGWLLTGRQQVSSGSPGIFWPSRDLPGMSPK
jgi:zinc protease